MRYTWIHAINEPRNFSNKYNIGSMENDNIGGGVGFSLHCMSIDLLHTVAGNDGLVASGALVS